MVVAAPPQLVMTNAMTQNNNSIRFIIVLQKNIFVRRESDRKVETQQATNICFANVPGIPRPFCCNERMPVGLRDRIALFEVATYGCSAFASAIVLPKICLKTASLFVYMRYDVYVFIAGSNTSNKLTSTRRASAVLPASVY